MHHSLTVSQKTKNKNKNGLKLTKHIKIMIKLSLIKTLSYCAQQNVKQTEQVTELNKKNLMSSPILSDINITYK